MRFINVQALYSNLHDVMLCATTLLWQDSCVHRSVTDYHRRQQELKKCAYFSRNATEMATASPFGSVG